MIFPSLVFFFSLLLCVSSVPEWVDLECEDGHRYLFSTSSLTWSEARGECMLYGGHLVSVNSLQEQNCLLTHAQTAELAEDWYWTDASDREIEGVFLHTSTNTPVTWLESRW